MFGVKGFGVQGFRAEHSGSKAQGLRVRVFSLALNPSAPYLWTTCFQAFATLDPLKGP